MARYTVELLGVPRQLANMPEIELELAPGASLRDVLAALAERVPALIGGVIASDGSDLAAPYRFNLNGRFFPESLDLRPQSSDRIIVMSPMAGG